MDRKLLKDKNFFLLMQGMFVSLLGSHMQTFALSLYVLNTYQSTGLFASILVVAAIPRLVLGPFAGVLTDWLDRKKIIVLLDLLSGLIVLTFAGLYYYVGHMALWSIYALVISLSLLSTLFNPTIGTMIPSIVQKEDIFRANALRTSLMTIAAIAAPLLASALMGFSTIGMILMINGVSFLVSSLSEVFIKVRKVQNQPSERSLRQFKVDFVAGLKFLFKNDFTLGLITFACIANFTIAPFFSIVIPHVLKKELLFSDIAFGLFESVLTGATLLAGILAMFLGKKLKLTRVIRTSIFSQGISMGLIGLVVSPFAIGLLPSITIVYGLVLFFAFITIMFIQMGNIGINTKVQQEVPNEMLGRTMTVADSINNASIPLGQAIVGLVLDQVIASYVLLGLSAFFFATMGLYYKRVTTEGSFHEEEAVQVS